MREVSVIGLDLAKQLFQLHGVDAHGRVVLRRRPPNVVAVAPAQQARPPGLGSAAPRRALAAPAGRGGDRHLTRPCDCASG